jgi:crotonobetainyl-CoA:carnitine CoA-transferase CaiB-like acyl-CoA transferase
VVVACLTDAHWQRLAATIGCPDLAADPRLATLEGRAERHDDLDAAISAWTVERDAQDAMSVLQDAGVPAGAVQTVGDLLEVDPQLRERGYYEEIEHAVMGTVRVDRAAFRLASIPGTLDGRAAPLLGEHDDEVLGAILGLSDDEIGGLRDQQVVDGHLLDRSSA